MFGGLVGFHDDLIDVDSFVFFGLFDEFYDLVFEIVLGVCVEGFWFHLFCFEFSDEEELWVFLFEDFWGEVEFVVPGSEEPDAENGVALVEFLEEFDVVAEDFCFDLSCGVI